MVYQRFVECAVFDLHEHRIIFALRFSQELKGLDGLLVRASAFLDPSLSRGCILADYLASVVADSLEIGFGVSFVSILDDVFITIVIVLRFIFHSFLCPLHE